MIVLYSCSRNAAWDEPNRSGASDYEVVPDGLLPCGGDEWPLAQ